jgi:hypothetical protein
LYTGQAWKKVATGHLLHPPSDGVQFDRLLATAMPDEWEQVENALNDEADGGKTSGKADEQKNDGQD